MTCLRRRTLRLVFGALLSGTALSVALTVGGGSSSHFAPYAPQALPQRADGDLDGDGKVDVARINDRPGSAGISIELSGSSSRVDLEGPVTSVVEGDVDHDGDLDLLAETDTGDLSIWINDGHGGFTRQAARPSPDVSSHEVVDHPTGDAAAAIRASAPVVPARPRGETPDGTIAVRATAAHLVIESRPVVLPASRAPPARVA